jgi:tetratricopeptide (TPR) repeat protein
MLIKRNILLLFLLFLVILLIISFNQGLQRDSVTKQKIADSKLIDYQSLRLLFEQSHYDAVNTKGSEGLLKLISIIENDERYLSFDIQKLRADSYKMLSLDKNIEDIALKQHYQITSQSLYQTLWDSYPYDRDVAELLLESMGNRKEAGDFLLKLLKKDPNYAPFLRSLSLSHLERGDIAEAIKYQREAYLNESNILYKKIYGNELSDLLRSENFTEEFEEFELEFNNWVKSNG